MLHIRHTSMRKRQTQGNGNELWVQLTTFPTSLQLGHGPNRLGWLWKMELIHVKSSHSKNRKSITWRLFKKTFLKVDRIEGAHNSIWWKVKNDLSKLDSIERPSTLPDQTGKDFSTFSEYFCPSLPWWVHFPLDRTVTYSSPSVCSFSLVRRTTCSKTVIL